ncbi:ATP-dependent DNA helicase PIF1, partial [Trifolium medium]|nr:ATP-dependent DNA helicase PIF1 [Trifolium medium]
MAPKYGNISEINPKKESWSIAARIIRIWFVQDANRGDTHPFSLDMVLMDASV